MRGLDRPQHLQFATGCDTIHSTLAGEHGMSKTASNPYLLPLDEFCGPPHHKGGRRASSDTVGRAGEAQTAVRTGCLLLAPAESAALRM